MEAQLGALDVVAKFGAKDDLNTDLSKPLLDAWKEACASPTPSTIVIPKGTYLLSQATLEGPCKAPIELQVQGNIKAPADPKAFKEPKWVSFLHVENFKLFGGGAFDGQGTAAYKREGCENTTSVVTSPRKNIRFDYLTMPMIQDITIRDSNSSTQMFWDAKNITFESVTVSAPEDSPNTWDSHREIRRGRINVKLSNISFKNIHGTAALSEVVKLVCSGTFPCKNVELADIDITFSGPNGPAKSECKNVTPKITGKQNPVACSTPVPANPTLGLNVGLQ
ncbi:polygalacturonase-like [Hibiscus syriacus]|uniref:polygalacturonase-like n=1 Tax=Hibiscus syriacus TaxID=106335 RepID=UPI001923FDEF|nr:polygalacturonase-like [Hibiscus syriacus]